MKFNPQASVVPLTAQCKWDFANLGATKARKIGWNPIQNANVPLHKVSRLKVVSKFLAGRACNLPVLLLGTSTTNKAENAIFMRWVDCKINNDRGLLFFKRGTNTNRGESFLYALIMLIGTLFLSINEWKKLCTYLLFLFYSYCTLLRGFYSGFYMFKVTKPILGFSGRAYRILFCSNTLCLSGCYVGRQRFPVRGRNFHCLFTSQKK